VRLVAGQSHERYLDDNCAVCAAPYGAHRLLLALFPTLKRGANDRCASGAIEIGTGRERRRGLVRLVSRQSYGRYLDDNLAVCAAPYGAHRLLLALFPTLKRGANDRCASGAIEIGSSLNDKLGAV